jgi:hypothetical protein
MSDDEFLQNLPVTTNSRSDPTPRTGTFDQAKIERW